MRLFFICRPTKFFFIHSVPQGSKEELPGPPLITTNYKIQKTKQKLRITSHLVS